MGIFLKGTLHTRLGPSANDDPMECLTKLKQTSTVSNYKAQFEVISNRIKGLFESQRLSCLLSGLGDEIRLPIRMLYPSSLHQAFGLAKIQEEYWISSRRGAFKPGDTGWGNKPNHQYLASLNQFPNLEFQFIKLALQ